jgi:nucleoside transporter
MTAPNTNAGISPPANLSLRLSVMMFLEFFVWGAWYVSMTGWMKVEKLDGLVAWAYSVGPIAAIVSPFFLGMIADRFFATQRVLGVMHLLGGAALLAVPYLALGSSVSAKDNFFHPFVLLLLAHMLCFMPTLGLTNSLSFAHITNSEKQFPLIRVFGTIGWIAGNLAVSYGLPEGDKSAGQWYLAGGAAVLLGLFSFTLPHTPPPSKGKAVSIGQILGLDAIGLLAKPSYLVFIICSFLICIPLSGYYAQARNFVEFTGFAKPTTTMSFGQMSEILFMLVMPLCFARLGVKWMLAVGMLAWVARYGLFAAAADDKVMWMVLGGVILHGICYDFFFVTGFIYVDKAAPHAIRGQAQGFLVLVTQGLGMFVGARAFGRIVGEYTTGEGVAAVLNWKMIWAIPAGAALVVLLVFVAAFRDRGDNSQDEPRTE